MTHRTRINYWIIGLLVIIGVHLFILSRLIFFPYPELFIYSYLTDQGFLPYKQILDQHFPGLMFFPINLHTLGMTTPAAARIWHYALVSATHILLFLVARRLFKSEKWALFTNFLYLIWQPFFEGYVLWIDTFVPIFLLGAFYFLQEMRFKPRNLFLSGLLLGTALLFKQVAIPLIVILGFLFLWKIRKVSILFPYAIGVAIPIVLLVVYILTLGVWQDFVFWTVTFNLTIFAQMGRKLPDLIGIVRALPVFGLAGMALWLFVRRNLTKFSVLSVFFLASLVYAFARFDYVHLQPALPFALLILVSAFLKIEKRFRQPLYLGFIVISFVLLALFYRIHIGDRVLFFGDIERKISDKVRQLTNPQDSVFALGTTPHLYQMTNTLPSGGVFVFQFPWFMTVAEDRVLAGIINDPPKVVVRDRDATVGGQRFIKFMPKINKHVERYYKVTDRIDGVEIMVRR